MIVLGISEGLNGAAVLIVDDEIVAVEEQASCDGRQGTTRFPWAAMEAALQRANIRGSEVERIAVAGRFAPPFLVRRFPGIRKWLRPKPASPIFDAASTYQYLLGWSGFGAFQEDQTAAWLERKCRDRGLGAQSVRLVHTHHALAAAAYVCQSGAKRDIVAIHARGDGPPLMRFEARDILIQECAVPSQWNTLHTWLERAMSRCGFDPWNETQFFWYEAMCGSPDPLIVDALSAHLRGYGSAQHAVAALMDAPIQAACASAVAALSEGLGDLVADTRLGPDPILLTGGLVSHPLVRGHLAERNLSVEFPAHSAKVGLALGAAAKVAGLGPLRAKQTRLRSSSNVVRLERALGQNQLKAKRVKNPIASAAKALAKSKAVAVFSGTASQVVIRADAPELVAETRRRLGQGTGCLGSLWLLPEQGRSPEWADAALVARRTRSESLQRYAHAMGPSEWTPVCVVNPLAHPVMYPLLSQVRSQSECDGFVCLPLASGSDPSTGSANEALRISRHSGLDGVLLGPYWVGIGS